MKNELEQAINLCIEALNNKIPGSQDVEGNSEYVLATIQKIAQMPYHGKNLGIGDYGNDGDRISFEQMIKQRLHAKLGSSLSWKDTLLVLLDFANYNNDQLLALTEKIVNDNIMFNHVMKHIISNCVMVGDIAMAEKLIPNFKTTIIFKEEDNLDMGYLIILKYYALQGDDKNFFKYFKQSKPAINKNDVAVAKETLVKNYTQKNNIAQGIALCQHKSIGTKFYFGALMAYAEKGNYAQLKEIFEKYPELRQPEAQTELQILTIAYLKSKEKGLQIEDDFDILFARALAVDKKIKSGEATLKDAILLDLGLANIENEQRVAQCKKEIKASWLKKELITK